MKGQLTSCSCPSRSRFPLRLTSFIPALRCKTYNVPLGRELNASVTDLQKYLELEHLEYIGEFEIKRKNFADKVKQIEADLARRGFVLSGQTFPALVRARGEFLRDLSLTRTALRRRFGGEEPLLLSDAELDKLQAELETNIRVGFQAQHEDYQRRNMAAGMPTGPYDAAASRLLQTAASSEVTVVRREISKLKLQRGLGMEKKSEGQKVVLNISNSTVSGLNLGTVVGDMNATLTTLEEQGNSELAQALRAVSEAIASDEQLGTERRELLENISLLGEEGELPAGQRRTGVVRAAYRYLGEAIAIAGHSAAVWATWGPQIAAFFGLPH